MFSFHNKSFLPLPLLKSIDHNIRIQGQFSSIRTSFKYKNENEKPMEMEYHFPKNIASSLFNVVVVLTDPESGEKKTLVGDIEEKEFAEEKYDDAIATGDTSMLLKQSTQKSGVCILLLGNVPPKAEVDVMFDRIEELEIEGKINEINGKKTIAARHSIPAMEVSRIHHTEDSSIGYVASKIMNIKYEITSQAGDILEIRPRNRDFGLLDIRSSEDAVKKNKKIHEVTLKERVSNDKNFTLEILYKDFPTCSWFYDSKSPSLHSHCVSFFPQVIPQELPKTGSSDKKLNLHEIILVVDRSGSMSGTRMRLTVEALQLFLFSLDADSEILFNICSFGSSFDTLFPESVLFDETNFATAQKHVQGMKASYGGTNMYGPLESAISAPIRVHKNGGKYMRNIFLLNDGDDMNREQTMDFVIANSERARIYSFGIGMGINPHMLTEISRHTKGTAVFIERNEMIEELVVEQLERSLQPQIRDLKITFTDACLGKDVFNVEQQCDINDGNNQKNLGSEYETHEMMNFEHTSKCYFSKTIEAADKLEAEIEYSIGNQVLKEKVVGVENDLVGFFVAQKRIENLEGRIKKLKKNRRVNESEKQAMAKKMKEEIGKIGKCFHLVTSQTSFVLVAENEVKINDELIHQVIPTILFENLCGEDEVIRKRWERIIEAREREMKEREERIQRKKEEDEKRKLEEEQRRLNPPKPPSQQQASPSQPRPPPVVRAPTPPPPLPPKLATERDRDVFMAKACEQGERYEDMFEHVEKYSSAPIQLSVEERNLLSVCMKNIVGKNRASSRVLHTLKARDFPSAEEETNQNQLQEKKKKLLEDYIVKVNTEMETNCERMISVCKKLIKTTHPGSGDEYLCFMYKLVGDYERYKCEMYMEHTDEESTKLFDELKERTKEAYKKAGQHSGNLATTHPLRLGLQLNLSVFAYEVLKDPSLATKIAKGSFEDAIEELDTLSEEEYKDSTLVMQLLKDNLTLWTNGNEDLGEEEEEDEDEDIEEENSSPCSPSSVPVPEKKVTSSEVVGGKKKEVVVESQQKVVGKTKVKLNELLFNVSVRGVWACNGKTAKIINFELEEIKKHVPELADQKIEDSVLLDLWMTAIVIVLLEKFFRSHKVKWRMIVKKSNRVLQKYGVLEKFLMEARNFFG